MKMRIFPPTSLSPGPHKLTAQERLKEIIDEHGLINTLYALQEETCRRCMEDTSQEAKVAFNVLRCVLEDIDFYMIEETIIERGF
jgi:hypothetical protein